MSYTLYNHIFILKVGSHFLKRGLFYFEVCYLFSPHHLINFGSDFLHSKHNNAQ